MIGPRAELPTLRLEQVDRRHSAKVETPLLRLERLLLGPLRLQGSVDAQAVALDLQPRGPNCAFDLTLALLQLRTSNRLASHGVAHTGVGPPAFVYRDVQLQADPGDIERGVATIVRIGVCPSLGCR